MSDTSGEDAFLRRARLSQQQQHQRSHVGDAAPAPNHESQTHGRPTFVASTQQAPSKGDFDYYAIDVIASRVFTNETMTFWQLY
jgi:hypothetical protein